MLLIKTLRDQLLTPLQAVSGIVEKRHRPGILPPPGRPWEEEGW